MEWLPFRIRPHSVGSGMAELLWPGQIKSPDRLGAIRTFGHQVRLTGSRTRACSAVSSSGRAARYRSKGKGIPMDTQPKRRLAAFRMLARRFIALICRERSFAGATDRISHSRRRRVVRVVIGCLASLVARVTGIAYQARELLTLGMPTAINSITPAVLLWIR